MAKASAVPAVTRRREKGIRTLVVDDSADFVHAICSFLEVLPNVAVIGTGSTGREAVVLAHEWMPDLILMDVWMPEMTGLEAAAQLAREQPDVVVILTSAFEDESVWRASKKNGAFAFVMKEHLTQELSRLLEMAAAQKGWNNPTKNCA
jgi:DNA-binding NarL/FixJ family response regulator